MKNNFFTKNKGFTIVELLAVIALLGVILTIATLSISSIQHKIQANQKENVISNIKVAAKKYVNDTGIKKVYVDTLITQGLLEADNEAKEIIDPVEKEPMNCYLADFTDETNPVVTKTNAVNGVCDEELISDAIIGIKYCNTPGCNPLVDGQNISDLGTNWNNFELTLAADITGLKNLLNFDPEKEISYMWIIPLDPSSAQGTDETLKINIPSSGYINDTYQVKVYYDSKEYSASVKIKIDNKEPEIKSIVIDKENEWSTSKTLSSTILDSGSGLSAYAITTNTQPPLETSSEWKELNTKEISINNNITESGTYYIWLKDFAGNINTQDYTLSKNKIEVSKVDGTAPECVRSELSTTWKSGPQTIWWGCKDDAGGSGCVAPVGVDQNSVSLPSGVVLYSTPVSISNTTTTYKIPQYTIYDAAGNEKVCTSYNAPVYIDASGPTISQFTITSNEKSYNSNSVTITINAEDNQSGISNGYFCITSVASSNTCIWQKYTGGLKEVAKTFDASGYTTGQENILYMYAKDNLGNISSSKSASYKLYKYCSKSKSKNYTLTTNCTVTCGGGYYEKTVHYYDTYFTNYFCTNKTEIDYSTTCNTTECCDEGTWEYYSCSKQGFVIERRYNGCKSKWEERTTEDSCNSGGTCSIPGKCDNGIQEYTCSSMVGGKQQTTSHTQSCSDDVILNDYFYTVDCSKVYVSYCEGPLEENPRCKVTELNDSAVDMKLNYNTLLSTQPAYCTVTPNGSSSSSSQPDRPKPDKKPVQDKEEEVNICDISGEVLFGRYKGHYEGNSGAAVSAKKSWGDDWCHANGTTCYASIGYERICVADECGEYKGQTSKALKKKFGCTWASYWCACK